MKDEKRKELFNKILREIAYENPLLYARIMDNVKDFDMIKRLKIARFDFNYSLN